LPLTYLHVFPYSSRPRTRAEKFVDDVPVQIKKKRVAVLRKLSFEKRLNFYSRFVEKNVSVLVERKRDRLGLLKGYSPEYLPVRLAGPDRLMEREIAVRILKLRPEGEDKITLYGEAA